MRSRSLSPTSAARRARAPLELLTKGLFPGLVSHSTNLKEHPELVQERLVRLGRLVGPDRPGQHRAGLIQLEDAQSNRDTASRSSLAVTERSIMARPRATTRSSSGSMVPPPTTG